MALSCSSNKTIIPAQTLFLGASIADFSVNMGWGGQASQLSVTLVEDGNPFMCRNTSPGGGSNGSLIDPIVVNGGSFDTDNHYHTCSSDTACYMDEKGRPFNPNGNPPSQERIVPGKVHYAWTSNGFVSRYWRQQDPGFFGFKSAIDIAGNYNVNNYNNSKGFDLINTPVFFKIGDFNFSGIIQSHEKDVSNGGLTYRVNIESVDSLLSSSYIILGGYAGSIFSKFSGATYGGPKNFTGSGLVYNGKMAEGNLPNVFNVYGFLESMGFDSFGASYRNENGISARAVINALSVLTSAHTSDTNDPAQALLQENKKAFSPFGRILLKTAQENQTYRRLAPGHSYSMGLIPPTLDLDGVERCHFSLDLSEMPIPPNDYRLNDNMLSIMDFISNVCEDCGVDFYFDMLVVAYQGQPLNVIKVRTVNRRIQPSLGQIESTIKNFADNGFPMSAANLGREKSESSPRVLYIGGKQQRLYQAKSYRLGFARSNYVWNPVSRTFVDFTSYDFGKIRMPSGLSTRNTEVSNLINGSAFTDLFDTDETIKQNITGIGFTDTDADWADANLSGSVVSGNYGKTKSVKRQGSATLKRFFPLFQDVICPFFGFQMGESIPANASTTETNDFRIVRPVYLDTWTGQIVFVLGIYDLPSNLNVPLTSLYGESNQLIITETEIRAAMAGFDSYIAYGLGKIFKPDSILMLAKAYASRGVPMTGVGEENEGFLKFPSLVQQYNMSNEVGAPGTSTPQPTSSDINFDLFLNPNLVKDLTTIVNFIAEIGSTYYGKQYLVRMPEVTAYRDSQYSGFQIPVGSNTVSIFKGSGKILYNYEPINEGAWEEPGNTIDDSIVIGSPKYYTLCEDDGKMGPILGYNVSDSYDYVSRALCGLSVISQAAYYEQRYSNNPGGDRWSNGALRYDMKVLIDAAKAGACNDNKFFFMSIDMSSLSADEYVVVDSPVPLRGPYDASVGAFGPAITPIEKSKKMYVKASVSEDIVYLKPLTMEEPRVLVTTSNNVELATTSYAYQTDPNRTVISNIAIEDLLLYLKINNPPYDNNFIRFMAHYMSPIIGNTTLLVGGYTTSNSNQHQVLAPKAAHPYFAGIPLKSNQFTYGPWTNYPELIKSNIFPGVAGDAASRAVENLIGGVKVEISDEYVPWNYGSMSLLDDVVLGQIQANSIYQQVIETARIDTIGLPVLGLGSPFIYPGSARPPNGSVLVNNQLFTPALVPLNYVQKRYQANANPLENIPIVGDLVVAPNIPSRTTVSTDLNYNIVVLNAQYYNSLAPIVSNIQCTISPQQVRTTYNFRTHTRKLGLFNKENADRLRKFAMVNIKRNKELASQTNKLTNKINKETQQRLSSIKEATQGYGTKNLKSGLYGTSPTEMMIGRAFPFVSMAGAVRKSSQVLRDEMKKSREKKGSNNSEGGGTVVPYTLVMPYGLDPGENLSESIKYAAPDLAIKEYKDAGNPARTSIRNNRWSTYVGVYQSNEAPADLLPEYSLKSAMSLDGIFSPVSFYPTKFYSTYPMQKYPRGKCPYCNGTGIVKDQAYTNSSTIDMVSYQCPYCVHKRDGLSTTATTTASAQSLEILPPYIVTNKKDISVIAELGSSSSVSSAASTSTSSGSSGQDIAINLVSLQPIVVPYGEFRNYNAGSDDKCRHSIEVVAHGETPPQKGWGINTRWNMGRFIKPDGNMQDNNSTGPDKGYNADYFHRDLLNADDKNKLNNQRFFGLRGPIVYHGWGYDLEGYPVPNAADEPYAVDQYGNPKRFVAKRTLETTRVKFKELKNREAFVFEGYSSDWWKKGEYYHKVPNMSITIGDNIFKMTDDTEVHKVKIENDMNHNGAFTDEGGAVMLGDIISKTQEFEGGKWTEKKKSKEFYRNWAEHPNLWKVGPIDLRWDENRQVWTTKSSDAMTIYKMVYVTLEEDLTKSEDYDETYPARGFLDDLEYSAEKLPADSRRLVFVKDKGGYTAPRGAKLLCRYDKDSGFYEPVSKQTFVVGGTVGYGKSATIEMSYVQGRKSGEAIPTSSITFIDPFGFDAQSGKKGLFTFINGEWTLTAAKSN
jgi:hypothetical protein